MELWNALGLFSLPSPRRTSSIGGTPGSRGEKRAGGVDAQGWEAGGSSPSRQRRGPTPTHSPTTSPTRQRAKSSNYAMAGNSTTSWGEMKRDVSPVPGNASSSSSSSPGKTTNAADGNDDFMDVDMHSSSSPKASRKKEPRTPPTAGRSGGRARSRTTGSTSILERSPTHLRTDYSMSPSSRGVGNAEAGGATDRYIPHRASLNFDLGGQVLSKAIHDENIQESALDNGGEPDPSITAAINAIGSGNKHSRNRVHLSVLAKTSDMNAQGKRLVDVFEYKSKQIGSIPFDDGFSRLREDHPLTSSPVAPGSGVGVGSRKGTMRHIPDKPSRILDAPDLMDDYYLNLLHWGKNNIIAVALNQSVYLWHHPSGRIDNLMTLSTPDDYITSVQWGGINDDILAVGTSGSVVQLWDATTLQKTRDLRGHTSRVSSLSWNGSTNPHMLSSGARDSSILHHDDRMNDNVTATLVGHTQEICGLAWSEDGKTLASGGNENRLCIWDLHMSNQRRRSGGGAQSSQQNAPRFTIEEHNAAVKAVAWCPYQHQVLASGGGTADRTIRVWNTSSGNCLKSVDTGSQVCAIQWGLDQNNKELVSSHGFSDNQLILWKYSHSKLTKIQEFHGHSSRVLHLARSPDGATICSASADETIRFWDMFGPPSSSGFIKGTGVQGSVGAGAARSPKRGSGAGPATSPGKPSPARLLSSGTDRPGGGIR